MKTLAAEQVREHHCPPGLSAETAVFEDEAHAMLDELRTALADLIAHLRPPVRRAVDLSRRLELSQKVAWSVFNAAAAGDLRGLPALLPKRRAMEGFFEAAARQAVPKSALERAQAAFERFEESVAQHAGSREAYETMVATLGGRPDPDADLKHKRAAFRAMSLLWGRHSRVDCLTRIMHPSATTGLLDTVLIDGLIGLQRTRTGVALRIVSRRKRYTAPGDSTEPRLPEPLDPRETGPDAIGFLRDFCPQPLPEVRLCESTETIRRYELASNRLGAGGEITYFTGQIFRAESAAPGSAPGRDVSLTCNFGRPSEVFNCDFVLHRSICDTRAPEVRVYAWSDGSVAPQDANLLPLTEKGEYLGEGLNAARTPLIPRYTEMLAYAMNRMGWNADEFRVFRCTVHYPVLHTQIRMTLR